MAESTVNPYFGAASSIASSIIGTTYDAYQQNKQREWNEKMVNEQRDWDLNMWNMTNEYNDPRNQVSRMYAAGLNPLYYGLDGSSANTMSAASPLGYDRSKAPQIGNPVEAYQDVALKNAQAENIEAQTYNLEADTRKKESETEGNNLANFFKKATMDASIEAYKIQNIDLPKKKIDEINKSIDEMTSKISLMAQQEKSEVVKQGLMVIEGKLKESMRRHNDADTKRIMAIVPKIGLLMDAQTENQKMSASVSFTHSLYEAGLIDQGYIDKLVAELDTRAENEEQSAALKEWEKAVKSGNYFEGSTWFGKIGAHIANAILEFCATTSTALGPLSGVVSTVAGAKALKSGRSAQPATYNEPYTGKSRSLVGSYSGTDFGNPTILD